MRTLAIAGLILTFAGVPHVSAQPAPRAKVGVALGGGSARGIAHVGVLRWLEDHHIPVDVLAGTSMGGLIGGSYATGMSPDEIEAMLAAIDWDAMFGSSNFQFQNVRRKRDSRTYPSHLEFGLAGGLVAPTSLNSGQQVDLLLSRIAYQYAGVQSFDDLPTPFRAVAVDLKTAKFVVLDRGSLARAMRATMSLPLIFPPVEVGDQVLVDGGAMNNVPADVARSMGATKVIAVNVGVLDDRPDVNRTMLGLVGETLDAMMRANTRKAIGSADVLITVPLKEYGSLDWRRFSELVKAGYDAAEGMRSELLPFAVDETTWNAWHAARAAARRSSAMVPTFIAVEGAARADADVMKRALAPHVGRPIDPAALEADLTRLGGLDRYQSLTWFPGQVNGADGIIVNALPKAYGPPFMYIGLSLENTTGNDFRFGLSGRYLSYDVVGSGSELRIDGAVGSDPSFALSLYRPIRRSPVFIEPMAGVAVKTLNMIQDNEIVASYRQTKTLGGGDIGLNVGRLDEVRLGVLFGRLDATTEVGDPGLPELGGKDGRAHLYWTHDGQDNPIVPSRGTRVRSRLEYTFDAPDLPEGFTSTRTSSGVTQGEVTLSWFKSLDRLGRHRFFAAGGAGTSFNGEPLPSDQFTVGGPFRLGAFNVGERRGDHYVLATGGYLYRIARLPDFLGGPVFLGGWLETGKAYNHWSEVETAVHASVGVVLDSLLGPVFAGTSVGFDNRWRFYLGIGQIF